MHSPPQLLTSQSSRRLYTPSPQIFHKHHHHQHHHLQNNGQNISRDHPFEPTKGPPHRLGIDPQQGRGSYKHKARGITISFPDSPFHVVPSGNDQPSQYMAIATGSPHPKQQRSPNPSIVPEYLPGYSTKISWSTLRSTSSLYHVYPSSIHTVTWLSSLHHTSSVN